MPTPKFSLGQIVITKAAFVALCERGQQITAYTLIERHKAGDWGDLPYEDKLDNEFAVCEGGFGVIHSRYDLSDGLVIYVITESNRSATTLLQESEY